MKDGGGWGSNTTVEPQSIQARRKYILNAQKAKNLKKVAIKVENWEKQVREYEKNVGKLLDGDVKLCTLKEILSDDLLNKNATSIKRINR